MLPTPTTSHHNPLRCIACLTAETRRSLDSQALIHGPHRWVSVTRSVAAARRGSSPGDTSLRPRQQRTRPAQPSITFAAPSATGATMTPISRGNNTLSPRTQRPPTGAPPRRSRTRASPLRFTGPLQRHRGMQGGDGGGSTPTVRSRCSRRSRPPPWAAVLDTPL